jgi:hypothetical protein
VAGGWRRLRNEELHNLYAAPNIIRVIKSRKMRLAGHVVCMGEMRNEYKILVGKSEWKIPLRRPRRRWKNSIRTNLKELGGGGEGADWILVAQDMDQWRVVMNMVMNPRVQ